MAFRANNAYERFYDDAGTLDLGGGSIEFTVNKDVNTQIMVYTTIDLDVEQSNPYTLDAAGRITADVWIGSGLYSMVIRDSEGAFVRQIDDLGEEGTDNPSEVIIAEGNNRFRNGSMGATYEDPITLTTTLQEGEVTGVFGAVQDTPSGTLEQQERSDIGTQGYAAVMSNVDSGAAGEAWFAINLPRASAFDLEDKSVAIQGAFLHDYSGDRNVSIELYSPTSVDDFGGALQLLETRAAQSVPTGTNTIVSDVIDCSTLSDKAFIQNGLQVRFNVNTGSSSGNEIAFSDFSLTVGNVVPTYAPLPDEIQETVNIQKNKEELEQGTPVGIINAWPTATAPTGWLECDGSAVSRTTYADLFAVIGEDYGNGNGSTTFNLPDFRGEFLRGWDNGAGNDPDSGSRTDRGDGTTGDNVGTKQDYEVQSHTHPTNFGSDSGGNDNYFTTVGVNNAGSSSTNASGGNETRPRNVYVMWIIKA